MPKRCRDDVGLKGRPVQLNLQPPATPGCGDTASQARTCDDNFIGKAGQSAVASLQQQNKALHPTAYSSVRSSLRFRRRVSLSLCVASFFV